VQLAGGREARERADACQAGAESAGLEAGVVEGLVSGCSSLTALVFGEAEQADAVLYFEPVGADDSGFVVLRADAPRAGPADGTPC
jgi:hypothetical protein